MKRLPLFGLAALPFVIAMGPSAPSFAPPASCPAADANEAFIPGLQTGQAVANETTTTLRFSSDARACGEWTNEARGGDCLDHWMFTLTLPTAVIAPGTYDLAAVGATFGELYVRASFDRGCQGQCGAGVKGIGSIALDSSRARLIIDTVDDGCIAGSIRGFRDPSFDDAPDFNGAFWASRCAP